MIHTDLNQPDTVERLAAALDNDKVRTRLSAIKLSAVVDPSNSIIHPKVVHAALFDSNDSVKKAAFTALKRSKPNHETVINKLIETLVEYDGYERAKEILLIIQPDDNRRAQLARVLGNKRISRAALRRVLREIYPNNFGRPRSVRRGREASSAKGDQETSSTVNTTASSREGPTLPADKASPPRSPQKTDIPGSTDETPQETTITKGDGAFDAMKEVKNILKGKGPSNPGVYSQLIDSVLFSKNINNYERNKIIEALSDVQLESKDIDKLLQVLDNVQKDSSDCRGPRFDCRGPRFDYTA